MIHLLGTAPFDGYNITPTYSLPDGKNRLLLFLAAGTSATDTRDATYNGSTMTVVKVLNTPESYGSYGSAAIAYLEIPDTWAAGSYSITHHMQTSFMIACFGGVKKSSGVLATDSTFGSNQPGVSRAIACRPSGLVVTVLNAPGKTITATGVTELYNASGYSIGYKITTTDTLTPAFTLNSNGDVAYMAAAYIPKPNYGSVSIF